MFLGLGSDRVQTFLFSSALHYSILVIMFLPSLSASSNLFPFSGQVAIFASATFYDAVYLGSVRFSLLQFEWQLLVNSSTRKSFSVGAGLYSIAMESTW